MNMRHILLSIVIGLFVLLPFSIVGKQVGDKTISVADAARVSVTVLIVWMIAMGLSYLFFSHNR